MLGAKFIECREARKMQDKEIQRTVRGRGGYRAGISQVHFLGVEAIYTRAVPLLCWSLRRHLAFDRIKIFSATRQD